MGRRIISTQLQSGNVPVSRPPAINSPVKRSPGGHISAPRAPSAPPLNTPANQSIDGYADRLMKYIPTEAVGFWLAVSGMIQGAGGESVPKAGLLWLFFALGLVVTFAWTRRQTREPGKPTAWTQIGLSCIAFVVWVIAAGGPLVATWPGYDPLYGSLLLITYTTAVAFVIPPEK